MAVNIDPEEAAFTYRYPHVPSSLNNLVKSYAYSGFLQSLHDAKGSVLVYVLWILIGLLLCAEMLLWELVGTKNDVNKQLAKQ